VLLGVATIICAAAPNVSWAGDPDTGNVVFFRGGFAGLTSNRANELFTDVRGTVGLNDGGTGYYVGAGLDLVLTRDLWGMMSGVEADGEIGVEFKRFHSAKVLNTGNLGAGTAGAATALVAQNTTPSTAQITMLTVDVAPKLKFMEGSAFRPWIIPIGLDFHVISPPSNHTNYLDIGVQFGAGFEYQFWKKMKVGLDGRFHLASNQTDTVNNFGTIGPYLGIGF
jgi:opacity protein-like surface antigen